ncbi:MAG: anti-sigma factor family protein, partial [Pirellulaceae bacterium]
MMNQDESKDYGPLLMGLIDGELSTEEALEVNEALRRSATLREEYERLLSDAGKLKSLSQLETSDLIARRLWKSPYHRLMRNGSVWMILGGYGILILYA